MDVSLVAHAYPELPAATADWKSWSVFFTSETVKKKGFCVLLVLLMFVVVERLYNRTGLGLQHHFFFSNVQHHFIGQ